MAQLAAGFSVSSYVSTVNRQCSSGLAAVNAVAKSIATGEIEVGIAAGVESMSLHFGPQALEHKQSNDILKEPRRQNALSPWGSRARTCRQSLASRGRNRTTSPRAPSRKPSAPKNLKTGVSTVITVTEDDGIHAGTTQEVLAKLRPAFKPDGSTTAGTSSQVSDGAAAVLLARRSFAVKHQLPILGRFLGAATVGVEPGIMGVGPAFAIPKLLKSKGVTVDDVDFFEINEAFASQAVWCQRELGIPDEKLNPNGGALALGHPLGATGTRQVATAFVEAKRSIQGDAVRDEHVCWERDGYGWTVFE